MTTDRRTELASLTANFMDAFNRGDLEGVIAHFHPDGVYDEFNGRRNVGLSAVSEAFRPQFEGAFGEMKFIDDDLFIDADTGKVMASWRCTIDVKGEPMSWRGLDLIHFEADKVVFKGTYAKAKAPLLEPR
ncbi:MAG: nuclear transport factor 2 family protein [Actinomycetia bacterium]|nr:nuclear transport factor 2 family protein [Actinomycetes bacterium]MCP4960557.1 nuclear transport factor 2 family protein [Actinomycetes bacterium]